LTAIAFADIREFAWPRCFARRGAQAARTEYRMTPQAVSIAVWCIIVVAAGVGAGFILRQSRASALGWSLLVAAVSLAVAGALLRHVGLRKPDIWLVTHVTAALALAWTATHAIVHRVGLRTRHGHDAATVLGFSALACGMVAFIILIYVAVFELAFRTIGYAVFRHPPAIVEPAGLLDIAVIAGATTISLRVTREHALATLLLWLGTFAGVWVGLLVKPVQAWQLPGSEIQTSIPTAWPLPIMLIAGFVLAIAAAAQHLADVRRRYRAWPDHLEWLLEPVRPWPGFRFSAGIIGVAVLLLGCLMLNRTLTAPAAGAAAFAMFLLLARRWNADLAELGMTLTTVAVVAAALIGHPPLRESVKNFAPLLGRALITLAVMVAFWHALAAIWRQQLHDGQAWTTAGRMIPVARMVGFMLAAVGTLVAFNLALWPRMPMVPRTDATRAEWVFGLLGEIGLFAATAGAALHTRKTTLAWLSLLVLVAGIVFVHQRIEGSVVRLWINRHAPLILAFAAPAVAVLPLRLRSGHPYHEPLTVTGMAVLPVAAVVLALTTDPSRLAGRWVEIATLAAVGAWFAALARLAHLSALLWIGLFLVNLAALDLWYLLGYQPATISTLSAVCVTVSGLLVTCLYWRGLGTPVARIIASGTAVGAGLVAAALVSLMHGVF
jgi:hypothetical protein